jgi:hypothetical protein
LLPFKGSGTCKTKGNAEAGLDYECTGEFIMPGAAAAKVSKIEADSFLGQLSAGPFVLPVVSDEQGWLAALPSRAAR